MTDALLAPGAQSTTRFRAVRNEIANLNTIYTLPPMKTPAPPAIRTRRAQSQNTMRLRHFNEPQGLSRARTIPTVRQQILLPQPIRKANSINEKAQHKHCSPAKIAPLKPPKEIDFTDLSALCNAADLER
tara:strand:- start:4179 stop:4568 length:390 start_codon:yes stop_codon:yes gene_type:complete